MQKEFEDWHEPSTQKICNCCGQTIKIVTESGLYEDYLVVTKKWGYFSKKDLSSHTFTICEECYDTWIKTFIIPIENEDVIDIFGDME